MNIKNIEDKAAIFVEKFEENLVNIEHATEREAHETYLAAEILLNLTEGKPVDHEQIVFLKEQSFDVAKALALIGLQAIPGSSIAIIALEKICERHGYSLFPEAENDPIV